MALGDNYHGLPFRPKARHWLTLNKLHPITRGLVSYCPVLLDPGNIGGDQRDLGEQTPDSDLVWDAVGGNHLALRELGDQALPDGSTQYFSFAPAGGYDSEQLPQPGEPYTLLWFGRYSQDTPTAGIFSFGDPVIALYSTLYRGAAKIKFIERGIGGGTRGFTSLLPEPNNDELIVLIARSNSVNSELTTQGITEQGATTLLTAGTNSTSGFLINAFFFGAPTFLGPHATYAAGVWNRYLTEDEVLDLTADPYLPMRPTPESALHHLIRRPMPCPGYPVTRSQDRPHDQTDGAGGTIVLATHAPRVANEVIDLDFGNLTPAEQIQVEVAFDQGRGLAVPFRLTIPGDTGQSLVIFDAPLRFAHQSPAAGSAPVKLRVVNPADWLPAPSILTAATAEGNTVTLNVPTVITAKADLAIIAAGYTQGGTASVLRFTHRISPVITPIELDVERPDPAVPPAPHVAIGTLFNAPVSPAGDTVAMSFTGAAPVDNAMAVLVASGVKAVNAVAGVVLADPAGLTPTLQITTTVPNCLIIFAAHGSFDVQAAAMSIAAPARQHALIENTTTVTEELIVGSLHARRPGTHTVSVVITGAVTADVELVAVALEPLDL